MNKEKLIASGLLHQYALGLVDPEEEQIIAHLLDTYPELKEEVLRAQLGVHQFAQSHGIPPNPAREQKHPPNPGVPPPRVRRPVNYALVAAFLCILLLWYFQSRRTAAYHANQIKAAVENCDKNTALLQEISLHLSHPATKVATFYIGSPEKANCPVIFWNSLTQTAYFHAASLPNLSTDSCYQLWAEINGQMVRLAVLKPGTLQPVRVAEGTQSFHITSNPIEASPSQTVQKPIATAPL